jgi:hypothetical protein
LICIEETEVVEIIDGSNIQKAADILRHMKLHCNNHALQLPIKNGLVLK